MADIHSSMAEILSSSMADIHSSEGDQSGPSSAIEYGPYSEKKKKRQHAETLFLTGAQLWSGTILLWSGTTLLYRHTSICVGTIRTFVYVWGMIVEEKVMEGAP